MKDLTDLKNKKIALLNGECIEIQTIDKNDLRTCEVSFSIGLGKFVLWFNGQLVKSSRDIGGIINEIKRINILFPLELA